MPCYSIDGMIPVVHPGAFVDPSAELIGDVWVGDGVYVGPFASLRGDFGRLVLEAGSNIQDHCTMHGFPGSDTVVEEDGHIGHGAVLHGCRIRRNALVGMNAVVMDGAVVGEDAIVAAMCFVRAGFEVPARHLIAGVPGRLVRELTATELSWKVEGTLTYQRLVERCQATLRPVQPLASDDPARARLQTETLAPLHRAR
jgi:phenylacetic acid degradation protein